jgi:hypothetical protein
LPRTLEPIICPNPECHKKIEELVIVNDLSTTPPEQYYACSHCYLKLDWISTQLQKEKETERKEEPQIKQIKMGKKGSSRCHQYFGFLWMRAYMRGGNAPVPQECLGCPIVIDCVLKQSTPFDKENV